MQHLNPILNLPDFEIKSVQSRHVLVFDVSYKGNKQCGHCQSSKVRIKASFIRQIKHHSIGHIPSVLKFHRGLIEADRNAEHYLYAYGSLAQNPTLKELASFTTYTSGYGVIKDIMNFPLWRKYSPFRGSPVTLSEYLSGYYGAWDGYLGEGLCHLK